ncbi:MAG: 4-hydroxy-3-methylbut-2-enyl diphosphate reductase [Patescibacteria group bacterium]|nr:4-hydroxy-3-methylbut-2-enyl diphosphate reductase [Patescibacteria group bacterium]
MKVNLAKNCGFCGGVYRAYAIVKKEFEGKFLKNRILILGSLVHNENVMRTVKQWGIEKIKTLRSVKAGDIVIITAHGVGKDVMEQVMEKGCKLFDATCPKVSIIHKKVAQHHEKGFKVVIFGDNQHKEVKGINGWCENKAYVVSGSKAAKALAKKWQKTRDKKPIIIVSQTTQNAEKYHHVCEILFAGAEKVGREIVSIDTICDATSSRQKEAKEAAEANDAVVVVGGKKSANTRRLWSIARSINPLTVWVDDLHKEAMSKIRKITKKAKTVAVISGASTPSWDIRKIEVFLQNEGVSTKNKQ